MRATTVLWDIDGTLVSSGGVAARAFLDAVAEVTGRRPSPERRDYGGRLDPEIADMLLAAVGAAPTQVADVLAALERLVAERLGELRAQTRAYPGVAALLGYLARSGVRQTVVTGNVAAVARHKLEAGGLVPPIEPGFGGYGDSAPDRAAVARVALGRLAAAGWIPDPVRCGLSGTLRATSPAPAPSASAARWWPPDGARPGNWPAWARTSCCPTSPTRGPCWTSGDSERAAPGPAPPETGAFTSQQIGLAGNMTGGRDAGADTSDLDFRASTDFAARSRAREA